ncbi:MAG: hypothetical protein ABI488_18570 [Polyangiaceae bacterium]
MPQAVLQVTRAPAFKPCFAGHSSGGLVPGPLVVSSDGARIAVLCGQTRLDIIEVAAPERVWLSVQMSRIDLGQPPLGFRQDGALFFLFGTAEWPGTPAPLALDLEAGTVSAIPREVLDQVQTFWPSDDWAHVLVQRQDGALALLDGFAGTELANVSPPLTPEHIHDARFSPDGALLAVAGDRGLTLRDGVTAALHSRLDETENPWERITWSSDGRFVYAGRAVPYRQLSRMSRGASLNEVVEFDVATGRRRGRWSSAYVLASLSGRFVYTVTNLVRVERLERGTGKVKLLHQRATDEGYTWTTQLLAATPDDRLVFARVDTPGGARIYAINATNGGLQPGW